MALELGDAQLCEMFLPKAIRRAPSMSYHHDTESTRLIDHYLNVALGLEDDPMSKLEYRDTKRKVGWNWDITDYGHLDIGGRVSLWHACNGRKTSDYDPPHACYCGMDSKIRNALEGLFLADRIRDTERYSIARRILQQEGLLYWLPLGYAINSLLVTPSPNAGNEFSVAFGIINDHWIHGQRHSPILVAVFDISETKSKFSVNQRLGLNPLLVSLGTLSPDWHFHLTPIKPLEPPSLLVRLLPGLFGKRVQREGICWMGDWDDILNLQLPEYIWSDSSTMRRQIALHPSGRLIALSMPLRYDYVTSASMKAMVRVLQKSNTPDFLLEDAFNLLTISPQINCLTFSPDGRQLIVATSTGMSVWDIEVDEKHNVATKKLEFPIPRSHQGTVVFIDEVALFWHADYDSEFLVLREIPTWKEVYTSQRILPRSSTWSVGFSSDGNLMALCEWHQDLRYSEEGFRVYLREALSGKDIGIWQLEDSTSPLYNYDESEHWVSVRATSRPVFIPGKSVLAIGTERGSILIHDLSLNQTRVVRGHSGAVRQIAFSPDGQILVSAADDGTLVFWATEKILPEITTEI